MPSVLPLGASIKHTRLSNDSITAVHSKVLGPKLDGYLGLPDNGFDCFILHSEIKEAS